MRRPHVVFLTEGGAAVGLGHLSRCLALARALDDARVSFVVTEEPEVAALLSDAPGAVICAHWTDDAAGAVRTVARLRPDAIVVDSNRASGDLLASLRSVAPVVAVDDLAERTLPVDVVVNGAAGAERLSYARRPGTRFLLGPRYALLDPAYADAPLRRRRGRLRRILICLGGSSQVDATLAAVRAVDTALAGCVIEVAMGPFRAGIRAVEEATASGPHRVVVRRSAFGLRDSMRKADLAISGGGVTLCELAATATPAVAVCVGADQRRSVEAFADAGAALSAGPADAPGLTDAIAAAFGRLAADGALRVQVAARARAPVDGAGTMRVAEAIAPLLSSHVRRAAHHR